MNIIMLTFLGKPKIVKPTEKQLSEEIVVNEDQAKGIRGRRKPCIQRVI